MSQTVHASCISHVGFACVTGSAYADANKTILTAGEHADEMESSLGLAFSRLDENGTMTAQCGRPTRRDQPRLDQHPRPWHGDRNTGMGNLKPPADKGRKLMDVLVERLGHLIDLRRADRR